MDLAKIEPYGQWNGGFVYGFFFEKGIYDLSPMSDFIDDKFGDREFQRHLNIAVTNVLNGKYLFIRNFLAFVLIFIVFGYRRI